MFVIRFEINVTKNDIPALDESIKSQIKKAIDEKLKIDPIAFGKPLRYSLKGQRRIRVGDYRIIYRIEMHNKTVVILAIKHRKEIYE